MRDFISNNYQWLFSGAGIALILFFVNYLLKKEKSKHKNLNKNKNKIVINNILNSDKNKPEETKEQAINRKIKEGTRILFVDDEHAKFKMVSILKKAGWKNTNSIKDITDLDDSRAKESDFIFVDINGVGTTLFKDQGLGLASALKKKYPEKIIIIYSDETTGDRFHKALREVDDCLPKNAEPYQFINLIESLAQ